MVVHAGKQSWPMAENVRAVAARSLVDEIEPS
jgi:hypothetical protein